ncbi:MAG: hypothetical protein AAGA68_24220 [Pseudomonadota bacterium]
MTAPGVAQNRQSPARPTSGIDAGAEAQDYTQHCAGAREYERVCQGVTTVTGADGLAQVVDNCWDERRDASPMEGYSNDALRTIIDEGHRRFTSGRAPRGAASTAGLVTPPFSCGVARCVLGRRPAEESPIWERLAIDHVRPLPAVRAKLSLAQRGQRAASWSAA